MKDIRRHIIAFDESARSPAFGPMIIVGITIRDNIAIRDWLKRKGVVDSKKLSAKHRADIRKVITNKIPHLIRYVWPRTIDEALRSKHSNLNWLECDTIIDMLNLIPHSDETRVYIDSLSGGERQRQKMIEKIVNRTDLRKDNITMEPGLDSNNIYVSAASIIASDERYQWIQRMKWDGYEITSGEIVDADVIKYAKEHPGSKLIRWEWKNIKELEKNKK